MTTRKPLTVALLAFHLTLLGTTVPAADPEYAPVRAMPRNGIEAAQPRSPKTTFPITADHSHEAVRAMPRTNVAPMHAAAAVFAVQPRRDPILLADPGSR